MYKERDNEFTQRKAVVGESGKHNSSEDLERFYEESTKYDGRKNLDVFYTEALSSLDRFSKEGLFEEAYATFDLIKDKLDSEKSGGNFSSDKYFKALAKRGKRLAKKAKKEMGQNYKSLENKDIEEFSEKKFSDLEKSLNFLFLTFVLAGITLTSFSLTGNTIGSLSENVSNFFGSVLFIGGILGIVAKKAFRRDVWLKKIKQNSR